MKSDKIKYILEVCEKFRVRLKNDRVVRFNQNNGDRIMFDNLYFVVDINDEFKTVLYTDVKIIEVFE